MNDSPPQLTPEQYVAERIEQYQAWYDSKSVAMKKKYLRMRAFTVVGGALVPVLINVPWHFSIAGIFGCTGPGYLDKPGRGHLFVLGERIPLPRAVEELSVNRTITWP